MKQLVLWVKTHWYQILIGILALFLVFFMPKMVFGDNTWTSMNQVFLVLLFVQYLLYVIFKKVKLNRGKEKDTTQLVNVGSSVIAVIIGFLFGLILMLIVNPSQALEGFGVILVGGFNQGMESLGNMIYYAVPVILTGLSVAFAFRTGLFNIGATGQMTMGAFTAVYIGVKWGALGAVPGLHWLVAILGAAIAGAIWGAIPGLLKAFRNVNEVVSSIMLNYIAMYLNTILIKKYIYNQTYARAMDIKTSAANPTLNLDFLFPGSSINAGIVVAIVLVVLLYIILNKTTFGYELKAVGFNREASRYAGINAKRNIVISMMIAGAVAGIAGGMLFLVVGKNLKPTNVLMAEGFTGIAISLLGLNAPFGVLIAGLFFGSLNQGGYYLQLLNFKPEIIDIIIAVIIYMSALSLILQKFMKKNINLMGRISSAIRRRRGFEDSPDAALPKETMMGGDAE